MLRHVLVACCACLLLWIPSPRDASAGEVGKFLLPLDGKVLGVRSGDFDGNGRKDLVLLVETTQDEVQQLALWIVPTPATPVKRTGFAPDTIRRIPLVSPLARCGAVAVGRFGPKGQAHARVVERIALLALGSLLLEDVGRCHGGHRGRRGPRR